MSEDDELVSEILVSTTYTSVFFTKLEAQQFVASLTNPDDPKSWPKDMNIWFLPKHLVTPKTKAEIKSATPEQLREWLGVIE